MDKYISLESAVFACCKVLDKMGACHMGPFCPDCGCKEVRDAFAAIPAADVVTRDCFDRILAENDTMREQLAKIGKKPGDGMENVKRVRYGYWKQSGKNLSACSACGNCVLTDQTSDMFFCRSCGAEMKYAEGGNTMRDINPDLLN